MQASDQGQRIELQRVPQRTVIGWRGPRSLHGTVAVLFAARGYGFLDAEGAGPDAQQVFFHASVVAGVRFEELVPGDRVCFTLASATPGGRLRAGRVWTEGRGWGDRANTLR